MVTEVLDGVHAHLVGGAVDGAAADAAAGQPDGEAVGMVVAAVAAGGVRRPAELAGPHDQRLVQQAPRLQVLDQAGDGLIGVEGVLLVPFLQVAVLVPGAVGGPPGGQMTSTKRTPASTSRRARRHWMP